MKKHVSFSILFLLLFSCQNNEIITDETILENYHDSISYALGIYFGSNIESENIDSVNTEIFNFAVKNILKKDSNLLISRDKINEILIEYFINKKKEKSRKNLQEADDFLKENSRKKNVKTLNSGLQYTVLKEGTGKIPTINDFVTVDYIETFLSGEEFYNTYNNSSVSFYIKNAIKAWQEILILMKEGAKYKIYVHPDLAYGKEGIDKKIESNTLLIFEIELLKIETTKKN